MEPWPSWNSDDLKNRYRFYKSTGSGNVDKARADLEEFLAAESGAFNRGLEPEREPKATATRE